MLRKGTETVKIRVDSVTTTDTLILERIRMRAGFIQAFKPAV
jgi:hypothetical protein